MRKLTASKPLQIVLFLTFEVLSIGMGMGVPFFTILYGFLVGLVIPSILHTSTDISAGDLVAILRAALITSGVTLALMALIWLPPLSWLFDPSRDVANFGMPMILYSPLASFIGWIVLMVVVSPFLQFLMTLFGSVLWIVFSAQRVETKRVLGVSQVKR
jgi:hypothetical protein